MSFLNSQSQSNFFSHKTLESYCSLNLIYYHRWWVYLSKDRILKRQPKSNMNSFHFTWIYLSIAAGVATTESTWISSIWIIAAIVLWSWQSQRSHSNRSDNNQGEQHEHLWNWTNTNCCKKWRTRFSTNPWLIRFS